MNNNKIFVCILLYPTQHSIAIVSKIPVPETLTSTKIIFSQGNLFTLHFICLNVLLFWNGTSQNTLKEPECHKIQSFVVYKLFNFKRTSKLSKLIKSIKYDKWRHRKSYEWVKSLKISVSMCIIFTIMSCPDLICGFWQICLLIWLNYNTKLKSILILSIFDF